MPKCKAVAATDDLSTTVCAQCFDIRGFPTLGTVATGPCPYCGSMETVEMSWEQAHTPEMEAVRQPARAAATERAWTLSVEASRAANGMDRRPSGSAPSSSTGGSVLGLMVVIVVLVGAGFALFGGSSDSKKDPAGQTAAQKRDQQSLCTAAKNIAQDPARYGVAGEPADIDC